MRTGLAACIVAALGATNGCATHHVFVANDSELVALDASVQEVPAVSADCVAGTLRFDSLERRSRHSAEWWYVDTDSDSRRTSRRMNRTAGSLIGVGVLAAAQWFVAPTLDEGILVPLTVTPITVGVGAILLGTSSIPRRRSRTELPLFEPRPTAEPLGALPPGCR